MMVHKEILCHNIIIYKMHLNKFTNKRDLKDFIKEY